ncbi:FAD-dependent oxidoreductase [Agrococcus sp. SL85]|uniref:NAD(P)/FAD-dependent oxidoreductase n=1 Tax=Agrococcus sp. SL85 TaxID=2995141 RepID=UPI00226C8970|nr:FAD-dependent oxidoreductase [Agrococcus sp. SL85]WAC65326.1 FAD-dependent oxidoreductase [Agrococcus sp. SL85]
MTKILIVGGGYAGLYTARGLERQLGAAEAEITIVDPLPYMTYLPFLPEVAAGSIEPRHAVVSLRRHLARTRVVEAKVTFVDHAAKRATIQPEIGEAWTEDYDVVVMTAGSVSRTFPIGGVADEAIGMKTIEEAVAVRDRLLGNFAKAATLPAGPERDRLLTVVVVGGGFAGIETIAELRDLATHLLSRFREIAFEDVRFHLVEAMPRIMPEVSAKTAEWVVEDLRGRGVDVHLETQLQSAVDGVCELSTGDRFASDLIIWTAGVMANPVVRQTDLPLDERGRITALATLQVARDGEVVPDAWTAGDVSAVPDKSKTPGPGGFCVPNAQHAVRQAKLLSKNIVASLRGEAPREYVHDNLGAVAGLGIGNGVFQSGKIAIKGPLAWLAHRGYHGLAMPMWERKLRVFGGWWNNFWLGRDIVELSEREVPRRAFETFASRPKVDA